MSWSTASTGSQIAFGILAVGISIITIWQGHRFWKVWRKHSSQVGVSADIELGISPTHSPCHDHDLAENAISFAAITHARPYPPPLNSRTACPPIEIIAQSGEPISPLDLNDRKESLADLADLFKTYVMIPRIRPPSPCLDLDLSPRSKPTLSKALRSLDGIRIATPSTEFHRYEHDHIDYLNIGKAATAV